MVLPLMRRSLWPSNVGNQCLLMLVVGIGVGLLLPGYTPWLQPLATIFLQASQIVVMPYLISELIVGFGRLRPGSLSSLARSGGLVLLGLWLSAALTVVVVPLFLPELVTSEFFHAGLFERRQPTDLLTRYLPGNIFSALAADNFPAVVLFSCVLGILLSGIEDKEQLLPVLDVVRKVFSRLNKLVVKLIPFGVFALVALNVARLKPEQFVRMQAYIALSLISFVVLTLAAVISVVSLTPLKLGQLWRIVKGPLVLTASSSNLLIALPMLVSNLQEILPVAIERSSGQPIDPAVRQEMDEELAPLVSLGYSLPTLGQVASLVFIPFSAWYVDKSLAPQETARMLLSAIPASVSGLKAVMRQELLSLGLPIDLLQILYINGDWLYRFEKVLALEGLVVLALLVYTQGIGQLRFQPLRAASGLALMLALGGGLGFASRAALATALKDSYRNDDRLMALTTTLRGQAPLEVRAIQPMAPTTLAAIRQRGVLRVGMRADGLPWAFRNKGGQMVGFDVDLMRALAMNLQVRLQLQQAPLAVLETWLKQGRLDLVAGGIQASPNRAIQNELSRSYLPVNLALVVPDSKLKLLQDGKAAELGRPLELAVRDDQIISPGLEEQLGRYLGQEGHPVPVQLHVTATKEEFFSASGQQQFDGLLTTAESGASWAVLYPRTSLITPFSNELSSELVLLIGGNDSSLRRYVNGWLSREVARGGIQRLFNYWILLKG